MLNHFVTILVLVGAWFIVVLAFFILAVQLFITILEFKLTTLAGFVLVPFALWNKTSFLAERVLGNVVSSGVKVMVLAVIIGIGTSFFGQFINALQGQDPTLTDAMTLVLASLALFGLGIFGPGIASGLVSGAPQLGAGAAIGTAGALVGGTMLAGAAALGGARLAGGGGMAAIRAAYIRGCWCVNGLQSWPRNLRRKRHGGCGCRPFRGCARWRRCGSKRCSWRILAHDRRAPRKRRCRAASGLAGDRRPSTTGGRINACGKFDAMAERRPGRAGCAANIAAAATRRT